MERPSNGGWARSGGSLLVGLCLAIGLLLVGPGGSSASVPRYVEGNCTSVDNPSPEPRWHLRTEFRAAGGGKTTAVAPGDVVRFVAHVASGNADAFNLEAIPRYPGAHFPKDMEILERGSHPAWAKSGGNPHWAIKNLCHWRDKRTIRFLVKVGRQARPGRQLCLPFSTWGRRGGLIDSAGTEILRQCVRVTPVAQRSSLQEAGASATGIPAAGCLEAALASPAVTHPLEMHHAGLRPLTPKHWHSQGTSGWFQVAPQPEGCAPGIVRIVSGQVQMQQRTGSGTWVNIGTKGGNLDWKGEEFFRLYAAPTHAWPDYAFNTCIGRGRWLAVRGVLSVTAKDSSTKETLGERRYAFPAKVHGSCKLARVSEEETAGLKEEWGGSGSGNAG